MKRYRFLTPSRKKRLHIQYVVSRQKARLMMGARVTSISLDPEISLVEAGKYTGAFSIKAVVELKDNVEGMLHFVVNGVELSSRKVTASGTYTQLVTTKTGASGDSVDISAFVISDGRTSGCSRRISFMGMSYYGVITDGTAINETNIKKLEKVLKDDKKLNGTFSTGSDVLGRFVYAYPKLLGEITIIKDIANGFSYVDSVSKSEISINGEDYYLIQLTDATNFTNIKLSFN